MTEGIREFKGGGRGRRDDEETIRPRPRPAFSLGIDFGPRCYDAVGRGGREGGCFRSPLTPREGGGGVFALTKCCIIEPAPKQYI